MDTTADHFTVTQGGFILRGIFPLGKGECEDRDGSGRDNFPVALGNQNKELFERDTSRSPGVGEDLLHEHKSDTSRADVLFCHRAHIVITQTAAACGQTHEQLCVV